MIFDQLATNMRRFFAAVVALTVTSIAGAQNTSPAAADSVAYLRERGAAHFLNSLGGR